MADKYSESRATTDDRGSYRAEMNMTVKNHKDTEAEVVIIYSNSYADNLKFQWLEENVELEKKTSTEFRWKKVLQPDEIWVTKWVENYRR